MRVMIVVTHLLGTGHLARALTLARAFQQADHTATVVSGGMPSTLLDQGDVPLIQLPALRSDGANFTQLLDADGEPADAALLDARQHDLIHHLKSLHPDVLITELYPFGRRMLRGEFLALLEAADAMPDRPLIFASVRDILAPPSTPEKAAKTDTIVARYYDAVLVHADPDVTPLDVSWPLSDALRAKLRYTGYISPPISAPHPQGLGTGEIIVSAGGGDVGTHIFETALCAARDRPQRWRLLVGGEQALKRIAELRPTAPANVTIEPARPDFRAMLHHAAASVSMCGYNTAIDVLQAGCKAVFVPFDVNGEVEQTIRAKTLTDLSGIAVLRSADLTPRTLLDALSCLARSSNRLPPGTGFDGAPETVRIVTMFRAP